MHAQVAICIWTYVCVSCCAANICSCPNGSPKTGAACTTHGVSMCSSCKDGFTINTGQTACSGLCSDLHWGEIVLAHMLVFLSYSGFDFWFLVSFSHLYYFCCCCGHIPRNIFAVVYVSLFFFSFFNVLSCLALPCLGLYSLLHITCTPSFSNLCSP